MKVRKFLFSLLVLISCAPIFAQVSVEFSEQEVAIELPQGTLYGTLTMPAGAKKKTPIMLLIPGSGPTDRDCNSNLGLKTNAFVMLAAGLAEQGVATLRVDQRISGKSAETFNASNDSLHFNTFIEDNEHWIHWIQADKRFGSLTVCGHSQGSLTGMIAGQRGGMDRFISLAGAGRTIDILMQEQFIAAVPDQKEKIVQFFDSLRVGAYFNDSPFFLLLNIPPSVAPFLADYASYDPLKEIAKLTCPVLIVNGEHDIQVPVKDAELLHKAAVGSQLVIIPEMNHILKNAPADRDANAATYKQPELPINESLVKELARFVKAK